KKDPKTAPPVQPLADFLLSKLPLRDPAGTYEPIKAWQSQALLFVRWGLDPAGGPRREAFWKFAERVASEGTTETVLRDCFEMGFDEAQAQLAAYLTTAVKRTIHFQPPRIAKLPPLLLRNASDG